MKQGGAFLAIILAISGIMRFAGPGASSSNSSGDSAAAAKKNAHPNSEYVQDLLTTIQGFYGVWEPESDDTKVKNLASHWNVPDSQELAGSSEKDKPHPRADVHFAIAILPDPIHTRLALMFDREIEAIQEAAERQGYSFDRAIFPWDRAPVPQSDDVDKRREAAEVQKAREEYPGLLIFRGVSEDDAKNPIAYPAPLFVFVVGETPTSGIRKKQFQHAVEIMRQIGERNKTDPPGGDPPAKSRPLLILGPSTSGSLRSLKRELTVLGDDLKAFVYSGGITDTGSIRDFTKLIGPGIHFASFQENDDFVRDRFVQFACRDGYRTDEIATLSEGDTAYGSGVQNKANPDSAEAPSSDEKCSDAQIVRLRFPREISYFRAAYQNQTASHPASSDEIPVPQAAAVALNPEEIGTDDDAALPYAGAQTPATQEAVMLGIVSELNKHHTKFTIIYASDPLDQVFLARYLRTKYPRGKVVVTDPDLLLISQEDSSLRGVLGINTYPIVPGLNDTFCSFIERPRIQSQSPTQVPTSTSSQASTPSQHSPPTQATPHKTPTHRHDDRLFVSSTSIGTYNAMLALLAESEKGDANEQPATEDAAKKAPDAKHSIEKPADIVVHSVPPAPYAEYATPLVRTMDSDPPSLLCRPRPLVWLTMLGQDGFWPVVGLSDDDAQTADRNEPILKLSSVHPPSTNPDVFPLENSKLCLSPPPDEIDVTDPCGTVQKAAKGPEEKSQDTRSSDGKSNDGKPAGGKPNDSKPANDAPKKDDDLRLRLPAAWKIAYCFAVFLLALHAFLSLNGSILADSEPRAQFARIDDWRDVTVIALGAFALATAFVTIMFSGGPVIGDLGALTWISLWLPLPVFIVITTYDLSWLRNQWPVATVLAAVTFVMFLIETCVWLNPRDFIWFWDVCRGSTSSPCNWIAQKTVLHSVLWSTRLLHYTSGVSPVLPILFLAGAGYWWMWQSLRGVTLVDRRRPRLPDRTHPVGRWYRINDREAAELRTTAHPLFFKWSVVIVLVVVGIFLINVLDLRHPVQTVEGWTYDWIYTILLALMIGTLIGILAKFVFTWLKCSQILSGLDRQALREEFSRMKHLSWHSFWSPGGSTLRATYKVLQRGLDGLSRLNCEFNSVDGQSLVKHSVRKDVQVKIKAVTDALNVVSTEYVQVVDPIGNANAYEKADKTFLATLAAGFRGRTWGPFTRQDQRFREKTRNFCGRIAELLEKRLREAVNLPALMSSVERMQVAMADAAAELVERMLDPWWQCEKAPVVSEEEGAKKEKLPLTRILAEEFVALIYVNFLITVLLRMRTMVMAAIGMYVFIVLSMNVYPFEPHAALQTLAVVLLAVMGVSVAFVYAQMHRDPILSRLTSTTSGELGLDFWLKLASAGAIPVFSLLAVQFPEINRFLFSWLEPALQAVK